MMLDTKELLRFESELSEIKGAIDRFVHSYSMEQQYSYYEHRDRIANEILCFFVAQKFMDHVPNDF